MVASLAPPCCAAPASMTMWLPFSEMRSGTWVAARILDDFSMAICTLASSLPLMWVRPFTTIIGV